MLGGLWNASYRTSRRFRGGWTGDSLLRSEVARGTGSLGLDWIGLDWTGLDLTSSNLVSVCLFPHTQTVSSQQPNQVRWTGL